MRLQRPDSGMDSAVNGCKPKLVFFQWDHQRNAQAASYLLLHMQQQVKCLATQFDVVVINHDCDYAKICDIHQPDLTLFESGYRSHGSRRIEIISTKAHPHVPKLGFHNADPWCDRRAGFLSDMEQWGIGTYFAIGTMTPQYMPVLRDDMFVLPNFIDSECYHDYGQAKVIPVTLTGQVNGLYPWRQKVFPIIRDRYPCLVSPLHAYESTSASRMLAGEAYARVLNASLVVPTCGTMAGEVVRKHFEIPGAGACLVTQRSAGLEAAGFADMRNCVFADHHNVAERLDYLFAHPDDRQRIAAAGYDLVHARHTLKHRPQIYQWYRLNKDLQPGERIIQNGPFGDLLKVDPRSQLTSTHIVEVAPDRALLRQGDRLLAQDRVKKAEQCYIRCLDYVSYLPEAKFGLAICALRQGDADRAYDLLVKLVNISVVDYQAAEPDPVEWAYFLLALVCKGQFEQALLVQAMYPGLAHEEIRRAHFVLDHVKGAEGLAFGNSRDRKSIHRMADRSDKEWLTWFADVFERCRQPDLARVMRQSTALNGSKSPALLPYLRRHPASWRVRFYSLLDRFLISLDWNGLRPNVPPLPEFRYLWLLARGVVPPPHRTSLRRIRTAIARLTS